MLAQILADLFHDIKARRVGAEKYQRTYEALFNFTNALSDVDIRNISRAIEDQFNSSAIKDSLDFRETERDLISNSDGKIFSLGRLITWLYIESIIKKDEWLLSPWQHYLDSMICEYLGVPDSYLLHEVIRAKLRLFMYSEEGSIYKDYVDRSSSLEKELNSLENDWAQKIAPIEVSINKIMQYKETLDALQIRSAFGAMSSAFENFRQRKASEKKIIQRFMLGIATCTILMPLIYFSSAFLDLTKPLYLAIPSEAEIIRHLYLGIPIAGIEIIMLMLFRTSLHQYNAAQAEITQIEQRIAACNFIQDFTKFKSDSGNADFSKFESLVFGGIVSDRSSIPSTFDGLETIIKAVKKTE